MDLRPVDVRELMTAVVVGARPATIAGWDSAPA